MAADVIRTELRASGGRRVRAGLRGAIEHLAGRHGMSAAEQREFASEVDAECCKFTVEGEAGASCEVIVEEQEDQIEVKVLHHGLKNENLRTTNSAKNSEPHSPRNGHPSATFVRHFHRSATRS